MGGPLGESAVTRELTAAERERYEQARIARGEDPHPSITPEHRARLEADRAAAVRARTLVPVNAPRIVKEALHDSSLPDEACTDCTAFQSGAVELVIRYAGHVAVIQGSGDGRRWGYSIDPDPDPDEGVGHDSVSMSLPVAIEAVSRCLS